jgi:S-adenosylmethionine:tRNA-ribosyltransferase-isomerase (queuine synthetase)
MMLVEAFLQHKKSSKHLVELYEIAIKDGFQFYSFGDSMLIL